jgi:hypothetical protein
VPVDIFIWIVYAPYYVRSDEKEIESAVGKTGHNVT